MKHTHASHLKNASLEDHRAVSRTALGRTPAEQRAAAKLRGAIGRRVQLASQAQRYGESDKAARYTREANRLRREHEAMTAGRTKGGTSEPAEPHQMARHALAQGARGPLGGVPRVAPSLPPPDWTPGTTLAARL